MKQMKTLPNGVTMIEVPIWSLFLFLNSCEKLLNEEKLFATFTVPIMETCCDFQRRKLWKKEVWKPLTSVSRQ